MTAGRLCWTGIVVLSDVGRVRIGAPQPLVPGPGLPDDLWIGASNNNVDLAIHDDQVVLAWRTAPTHFAHADAVIHVVRGRPGAWAHELTVAVGRDVREPRLVSWKGRLLLYWFTAGRAALRFEPDRIWVAERSGPGRWDRIEYLSDPDHVVWRVRPVAGRLHMTVYRHAASLFTARPQPLSVEMWSSDDGIDWAPADLRSPEVHHGGAEADFVERPDGSLAVVVRKEGPYGLPGRVFGHAQAHGAVRGPPACGHPHAHRRPAVGGRHGVRRRRPDRRWPMAPGQLHVPGRPGLVAVGVRADPADAPVRRRGRHRSLRSDQAETQMSP